MMAGMPTLTSKQRAKLPDSAFAYIDPSGKRRLPIHDASHVRNALSRFNQVKFDDDDARDRARGRLLRAAQKHGIMPIGFISAQLRDQGKLPTGTLTFLLADIEGSTDLLESLGDDFGPMLSEVRKRMRAAVRAAGGQEIAARGDDLQVVFETAPPAVETALAIQRAMLEGGLPGGRDVRLRIGLHRGRPTLTDTGYVGISLHATARIGFACHGGQTVISGAVHSAVADSLPKGVSLKSLGAWRFRGMPEPIDIFQVDAPGLPSKFPPLRSGEQVR